MSQKILVLCVFLVCAAAAPPIDVVPLEKQQPTVIPIIAQSEELEANGTYKYSYETANGIKREETSYDKILPSARSGGSSNEGGEDKSDESNEIHVQQGSYSYTAPDGTVISVRYIADENGFRPIGDHLPKPPSILVAASRASGRTAKSSDSDVGSSAPVAAVAASALTPLKNAPAAPTSAPVNTQDAKTPNIESRIADTSTGQTSTSASEEPSTTSETPSTTEALSTASQEPSTTESSITTEQSSTEAISTEQSTTSEPASTAASEPSTTEAASTTASESSTTEAALTTVPESSTSDAASTPASELSTTEQASTSVETSTLPASIAETTFSSEATTQAATTVSV